MDWVNSHNASTVAVLGATPLYQAIYDRTKKILDSKDRIAYPTVIGPLLYNFWQDADHKRGIWRRTSWTDYTTRPNPRWETMLDVDALAAAEGVTWSWGGADCFDPKRSDSAWCRSRAVGRMQMRRARSILPDQAVRGWIPAARGERCSTFGVGRRG